MYNSLQYSTVQYCTVFIYCTVVYSTVLYICTLYLTNEGDCHYLIPFLALLAKHRQPDWSLGTLQANGLDKVDRGGPGWITQSSVRVSLVTLAVIVAPAAILGLADSS